MFRLLIRDSDVTDGAIMVQSNILTLELDLDVYNEVLKLNPDESIQISTNSIHRMLALNGGVDIIEVSIAEFNDVVSL